MSDLCNDSKMYSMPQKILPVSFPFRSLSLFVLEKHSAIMVINDYTKRQIFFYHEKGYRPRRITPFIARVRGLWETGSLELTFIFYASLSNVLHKYFVSLLVASDSLVLLNVTCKLD